ncbi:hypothetical protein B0H17DRAFT_1149638 [Mycena rosella]|uniref:Uncharacterized protein n=1 Tax=Mycena rosella TaxID=1033263 RepID=A0AAD7C0J3_MYCRO|nr:hypothetical protein B0H17DRAFT_1149638 [Mycena rosella]
MNFYLNFIKPTVEWTIQHHGTSVEWLTMSNFNVLAFFGPQRTNQPSRQRGGAVCTNSTDRSHRHHFWLNYLTSKWRGGRELNISADVLVANVMLAGVIFQLSNRNSRRTIALERNNKDKQHTPKRGIAGPQ